MFDRDLLRRWLTSPDGPVAVDEVTLARSGHGIVIRMVGVLPPRPVPSRILWVLREQV